MHRKLFQVLGCAIIACLAACHQATDGVAPEPEHFTISLTNCGEQFERENCEHYSIGVSPDGSMTIVGDICQQPDTCVDHMNKDAAAALFAKIHSMDIPQIAQGAGCGTAFWKTAIDLKFEKGATSYDFRHADKCSDANLENKLQHFESDIFALVAPESHKTVNAKINITNECKPVDRRKADKDGLKPEGKLRLSFDISSDGRVTGAFIKSSSGSALLDSLALNALRLCPFDPAYKSGQPVASTFLFDYVWGNDT